MIKEFLQSGQHSSYVQLRPGAQAIEGLKKSGYIINKHTLLTVRLVRVELANTTEILMTNLWEEEGYDSDEFKALYFMRWGIETHIGVQKNILQLEACSGLTVHAVLQDFYATAFMANLHALLLKPAQQQADEQCGHRKYPMKINKNKSFARLKTALITLFIHNSPDSVLQILYQYFRKDLIPIRKGRSFPRIRKNQQSKSRFKTFTNFKPAF